MRLRPLSLVALLVGGALMTSGSWWPIAADAAEKPAVVIHESVWDSGERDTWSAFTIRVSSERGFRGQLLLTPARAQQPQVVQQPGAPQPVEPAAPDGPTIRTDLALEPGVERLVSTLAPVSDSGYRAEVRDLGGRLIFAGQARRALTRATYNVGMLTDRKGGDAVFQVGAQLPLSVSRRFRSSADFPTDPLLLGDLEAIVVADFDSATLSTEQRQALQSFVAFGGTLLVTGGEGAARTLSPLPETLVPLGYEATVPASLSPLVELVGETTTATTAVITGPLRSGRVVVGGVQGPPLVVEAAYGLGRIIQLAYDPFAVLAEQKTGTPAIRTLPWSVGVLRAAAGRLGQDALADLTVSPPSPTWAALDQAAGPDPSKGGGAGLLLLAYPLLMAGAAVVVGRERGVAAWRVLALPALAIVVVAAVLPVDWGLRASTLTGDEVTIERIGPTEAPTLVESFHRLVPSDTGSLALRLAKGSLATTAPAPRPPRSLPESPLERAPVRRAPGDAVTRGDNTRVELGRLIAWEGRRLQTLASSAPGGWLEARLRLQGGRMVGTVTNRGDRPVRRIRVQAPDGARAELEADVPAGGSVQVDAPFGPGEPGPAGDVEASLLEAAARPVAGRSLRPGTLMAVGLLPDQPSIAKQSGYRSNSAPRAVATPVELEASDSFSLDFGVARSVCCGSAGQGPQVLELRLPTGLTGPFALEGLPRGQVTNGTVGPAIFDWTSGNWRPLPQATPTVPIEPTEISDGLVRIRAQAQLQDSLRAASVTKTP